MKSKPPSASIKGARSIVFRSVDELKPYSNNPRTHSAMQIKQIAASIERFGFTNPILLDGDNGIIAGHGRLQAAQSLGFTSVPCIDLHGLNESEKRAYVIADNQLALAAGWDYQLMAIELAELTKDGFDVSVVGFSDEEIQSIMSAANFKPGSEQDQQKLDALDAQPVTCPECGHQFDARQAKTSN